MERQIDPIYDLLILEGKDLFCSVFGHFITDVRQFDNAIVMYLKWW
jgi:hypothetical protein